MSKFAATLDHFLPNTSESTHLIAQIHTQVTHQTNALSWLDKSWLIKDLPTVLRRLHWKRETYRTVKILSVTTAVIASTIITVLSGISFISLWSFGIFATAITAGWFLPDQYLRDLQAAKLVRLNAQIPDFLQLFALSVASSGYISLVQILEDISMAMTGSLKIELDHILSKKAYLDSDEILYEITQLTPHPFLYDLRMILEIHQTYGGQLSASLVDLAHRAQTDRIQHAQELANASSGLLLGPLLLFHLPALLIIVLIPAVIAFTNGL